MGLAVMVAARSWWGNQTSTFSVAAIMITVATCMGIVTGEPPAGVAAEITAADTAVPLGAVMAAAMGENGNLSWTKFNLMKSLASTIRIFHRVPLVLGTLAAGLAAASLDRAETSAVAGQRTFASTLEAVTALQAAAGSNDHSALLDVFGPEFGEMTTGDARQDARNARWFATAMGQSCVTVTNTVDTITLEVGTNQWPLPIPLVRADGQWHFDTAAGREEIINRHIGKDELHAIGVCRVFATAQHSHVAASTGTPYALTLASAEGTHDGLYWPTSISTPACPFGPLVAMAQTGHDFGHSAREPQPFHGYYFKVLTRQGLDAFGGKQNYLHSGKLTGGCALVAYPATWGKSGIMTFIVNQDGQVYQQDFGETTTRTARVMQAYNPDSQWQLVADEGDIQAVTEQ